MNPLKFQLGGPLHPQPVRLPGAKSAGPKGGKLLQFPRNSGSPRTSPASTPPPDFTPTAARTAAVATPPAQAARPRGQGQRHRGLQVVAPAISLPGDFRESTQARANRIVAQVEWELEQKAARERQQRLFGTLPHSLAAVLPMPLETPASVMRRLFGSFFSAARLA